MNAVKATVGHDQHEIAFPCPGRNHLHDGRHVGQMPCTVATLVKAIHDGVHVEAFIL